MMRQLRGDWRNLLSMHQFHVNPATIPNSTRGNDVARVVGLRCRAAALRLAHSHADIRRTPLRTLPAEFTTNPQRIEVMAFES